MKKFMIWLIAIIIGGYGLFKLTYPSYSWNQKLTIEIETPEGLVSGSGVVKVVWRSGPKLLPDPPSVTHSIYGEATVVKLPDGRLLFALLNDASALALHVFASTKVGDSADSRIVPASEVNEHHVETSLIPSSNFPLLVTFTDINDPKTAKRVLANDLAATFGEGYTLKSITLTITNEPITIGRVTKIGFMRKLEKQHTLSGLTRFDKNFPDPINYLTDKAFSTGN